MNFTKELFYDSLVLTVSSLCPQWWRVLPHHPYLTVCWRAPSWSGAPASATAACRATSCPSLPSWPAPGMERGVETCLSACVSHLQEEKWVWLCGAFVIFHRWCLLMAAGDLWQISLEGWKFILTYAQASVFFLKISPSVYLLITILKIPKLKLPKWNSRSNCVNEPRFLM